MWKRVVLIVGVLFLAAIIVPVVIARVNPSPGRNLTGVSLDLLEYKEVSFRNDEQGLDLAGLLFVPEGEGPYPTAVIIHGSGTSSRDNPWYLTLTAHLQDQGIAVLLPDKRGSGGSAGDWRTSSFEDLATDTVAAVDYLGEQGEIEVSQIGIIGMSQGGQIAPIVAGESEKIDFVVNVVGSSLPIYDVLMYEETNNLRQLGFLPGVSNLIAYPSTFILREYSQSDFWDAVGNFDPLPYWKVVDSPTLVLYGSEDTNVPSRASRDRLVSLDQSNMDVRIYEGSGHALEDPPGEGDRYFREDALEAITDFIAAQAPKPISFGRPEFIFQGEDPGVPLVTHAPSSQIENQYINPGAVLFHDDRFHMFFNSFSDWPGLIEVGYMLSEDGYTWRMAQEGPVFTSDQVPYGDGEADVSSVTVLDDGTWVLYFHTIKGGEIGIATAESPYGPWQVVPQAVLLPGPAGAWDQRGVAWPNVVKLNDGFRMYFSGEGRGSTSIGLATSEDGIRWTKYDDPQTSDDPYRESDPILTPDQDWESIKVDRPRVTRSEEGWAMIFQASPNVDKRGLALSYDGTRWEKYPQNPVLGSEDFPVAGARTWDTALLYHRGSYFYWMEIGDLSGTNLYLAKHSGSLSDSAR